MLKEEFETLIGREVDYEAYTSANAAYESLPDMNKQDFCKIYEHAPQHLVHRLAQRVQETLYFCLGGRCETVSDFCFYTIYE